jgi:hypothetical protein
LQTAIDGAMARLGPIISKALICNIGGDAARSELDKLSEPLKKLVSQQRKAQVWLEAALFDEDFPSQRISNDDKTKFIKRIVRCVRLSLVF